MQRHQAFLLPPDLKDWLPGDDLAHFFIAAVERVALSALGINNRSSGSAQYHPPMMLALLIYSYANGIFSSRRIERATHRDIGVRFVGANTHRSCPIAFSNRVGQAEKHTRTPAQSGVRGQESPGSRINVDRPGASARPAGRSGHGEACRSSRMQRCRLFLCRSGQSSLRGLAQGCRSMAFDGGSVQVVVAVCA